jgi:hypothetical protein
LKYQRQCIEKGEQNLAEGAKEAANAVTKSLICGLNVRGAPSWPATVTIAPIARANDAHAILHFARTALGML